MAYKIFQRLQSGLNNKGIVEATDLDDDDLGKNQHDLNALFNQGKNASGNSIVTAMSDAEIDIIYAKSVAQSENRAVVEIVSDTLPRNESGDYYIVYFKDIGGQTVGIPANSNPLIGDYVTYTSGTTKKYFVVIAAPRMASTNKVVDIVFEKDEAVSS